MGAPQDRLCGAQLHTGLFNYFLRTANAARPTGRQRADTAVRAALLDAFLSLDHPYWSYRYTLGGRRLARPRALVGEERATSILVDVLLPMLLAHVRLEGDAELAARMVGLWRGLPRQSANAVTRRMERIMFKGKADAQRVVKSARRQQGLHQLYKDCCHTGAGCERCVLCLAHQAGKSLASP